MGMFSGRGKLGVGRHRAFAVLSESPASDIKLRFHDCCLKYKEPDFHKLKEPIIDEITRSLAARYDLNFTAKDTSTLWFLCKQEASLFNITDQACGLFSNDEANLLEWTDDLDMFLLKGYGNSLNYQMGVRLLKDIILSLEQAIKSKEEGHAAGSYEKARLRFAHAETLVPFSCLIGLFLDGSNKNPLLGTKSEFRMTIAARIERRLLTWLQRNRSCQVAFGAKKVIIKELIKYDESLLSFGS